MNNKYWDITRTAFRGCRPVSAGCDHCWAARFAWRCANNKKTAALYTGLVTAAGWTGKTRYTPDWDKGLPTKPKRILFNCMGDLFHEANRPGDIQNCLGTMARWPQHTFIVPTKRPAVAFYHLKTFNRRINNMVLLASVENQASADDRIPWALECQPHVKLVGASAEPLLGPIDFKKIRIQKTVSIASKPAATINALRPGIVLLTRAALGWVIVGQETGPHARHCECLWLGLIHCDCSSTNTPHYYKQALWAKEQELPI